MGRALDIELLLQRGHLRTRCAEEIVALRCRTCGCDIVPLNDLAFGCPACLQERGGGGSACRRCGETVSGPGHRPCRSAEAYRAGRHRSLPLASAVGPEWTPDPSPFARPAFSPEATLVQVEWNQGSRRCVLELERLPRWIAAGALPPHARARLEGADRDLALIELEGCRERFPDPSIAEQARIKGLADPDLWPESGRRLVQATRATRTWIEQGLSGVSWPTESDLAWRSNLDGIPPRLMQLVRQPELLPGPERDLVGVFSAAMYGEGGGFVRGVSAVLGTLAGALARRIGWNLCRAWLTWWYGDRRIDEARGRLQSEQARFAQFQARLETARAAWQSVEAHRATAEAQLSIRLQHMVNCLNRLNRLLDATRAGNAEPPSEEELAALRGYRIDAVKIRGIGKRRRETLSSAGIHTAADLSASALDSLDLVGRKQIETLLAWRDECLTAIRSDPLAREAEARRAASIGIEAAIDLQAARIDVLHCKSAGARRIQDAESTFTTALERARAMRQAP